MKTHNIAFLIRAQPRLSISLMLLGLGSYLSSCTGQLPGSFRLTQQTQNFATSNAVNTKIDLLWVVDNSSSMDVSQEKLRNGFTAFANQYMQPTWDIQVAVITTDAYLAHPNFQNYLNKVVPGTTGWASPYIQSRLSTFQNPPDLTLVNKTTGVFDNGVRYLDMIPSWGPNYAQLLPGNHDGPIEALCYEGLPFFLNAATQCAIRDNMPSSSGPADCLNPGAGQTSITQCVNTTQNNSVRSGKAIISTQPPAGTPADAAWTAQLVDNFMINMSTGSAGHGSERGLGSVLQMINDNESVTSTTRFFRPGSTRGIIFISDEDDQTMVDEVNPSPTYGAWTHYKCDQASLIAMNPTANIAGSGGFCCSDGSCQYGAEGTSCSPKTVDNATYTISVCPNTAMLKPVADVKAQLDQFFETLDGVATNNQSYFVTSVVALTGDSITALQISRNQDDTDAGTVDTIATDRADRYIDLGNLVGNGSITMDIGASDYTPILQAIGQAIVTKTGTFQLTRAPSNQEDMIVTINHADGTSTTIPASDYTISGTSVVITNMATILALKSTDQISINYQPKTID